MSEKKIKPCPFRAGLVCEDCPIVLKETVEIREKGKKPIKQIEMHCPIKHAAISLTIIADSFLKIEKKIEAEEAVHQESEQQ